MNDMKQVNKDHYEFLKYMDQSRWASIWHQLDEVIRLNPANVLEIGPGPGIFKQAAALFGLTVETLDLDPDLKPDHVGSATALSFEDSSYDVVCAFQMLEHLPYETALQAFAEMVRVCRRNVVISLPDVELTWRFRLFATPFIVPRLNQKHLEHEFNGEHYWEINKKGYSLAKVVDDFSKFSRLIKTYRVYQNPHHRFFAFEQQDTGEITARVND